MKLHITSFKVSHFKFQISRSGFQVIVLLTMLPLISCEEKKQTGHVHDAPQTAVPNQGDLMLSDTQIRLANITTQVMTMQPIGETILANGRLLANEELSNVVSSRVPGRIERLYFKESGLNVKKGEPLYTLFSESLLTLQKEFLLAKEQFESLGTTEKRYRSFYDASRKKLLLYGMTEAQIRELEASKQTKPAITFAAPASGVISEG